MRAVASSGSGSGLLVNNTNWKGTFGSAFVSGTVRLWRSRVPPRYQLLQPSTSSCTCFPFSMNSKNNRNLFFFLFSVFTKNVCVLFFLWFFKAQGQGLGFKASTFTWQLSREKTCLYVAEHLNGLLNGPIVPS